MKLSFEREFPWVDLDFRPARQIADEAMIKHLREGMRGLSKSLYFFWQRQLIGREAGPYDDLINAQIAKMRPHEKPEPMTLLQEIRSTPWRIWLFIASTILAGGIAGVVVPPLLGVYLHVTPLIGGLIAVVAVGVSYWLAVVIWRGFDRNLLQ
jgi:hypothetical protein